MPREIIGVRVTRNGYVFRRRSDDRPFFLTLNDDGSATLGVGFPDKPPSEPIRGFGVEVADKLAEARRWIEAYPNEPDAA